MNLAVYTKYGHKILRIVEPVGLTTDTTALRQAINTAFTDGYLHLAIRFAEDSFLSSRMLALIIESAEKATCRYSKFWRYSISNGL